MWQLENHSDTSLGGLPAMQQRHSDTESLCAEGYHMQRTISGIHFR